MKTQPIPRGSQAAMLRVLAIGMMVTVLSGCGIVLDLDVTLFTRVDLEQALQESGLESEAIPAEGGRVPVMYRTEIDLTEDIGDEFNSGSMDLTLESIIYRIPENSTTADLHDVSIVLADAEAQTPEGGDRLGFMELIPAGTPVADTPLETDLGGEEALEEKLQALTFTVFIFATVDVEPEPAPMPSGVAMIEVDIKAQVSH